MARAMGIITGTAFANSGVTLLARIVGADGSLLTQASLSSITYLVRDVTNGTTLGSGSLTIANVVYDTLQTDEIWTQDDANNLGRDGRAGYNFRWTVPTATMADADAVRVAIDVRFTPTSGSSFIQQWQTTPYATYVT